LSKEKGSESSERSEQSDQPEQTAIDKEPRFIVGIGASAGGLKSLESIFRHVPGNIDLAFVVISHLDPHHHTLLPELLARSTELDVKLAEDGMKVTVNTVHIIPPGQDMGISEGQLHLIKRDRPAHPIDFFFHSLATEKSNRAIVIVLSGTGSDGTLGARAVKEHNGLVIVEDPHLAEFSSMPESVVRAGVVDYILPVSEIPQRLFNYIRSESPVRALDGANLTEQQTKDLRKVLFLLRNVTGHDFSYYKRSTVLRRIERRMAVHGLGSLHEYAAYLQENNREAAAMFKELLIGVTNFFRDEEAFSVLKGKVIPDLIKSRPERSTVRVWVPGVATGEEAYSLAIVLQEGMEEAEKNLNVRIFGTDIDHDAIETARAGIYPASVADAVGERLLRKYFASADGGYQISRNIREKLIFAEQDVAKDPPFTHIDLISCRNLLIYLDSSIQDRLIPLFHYALQEEGYLLLGTSETLGDHKDLFTIVDSRWKVYRRRPNSVSHYHPVELIAMERPYVSQPASFRQHKDLKLADLVHQALLTKFAPPCVITDQRGEIIYVHGHTGRYLEPAAGQVNMRVGEMAREGLSIHLPTMIRKAATSRSSVTRKNLHVKTNDSYSRVDVTVAPLRQTEGGENLLMIYFEELPEDRVGDDKARSAPTEEEAQSVEELRRELQQTRDDLQSIVEELETSNEELRSMNEEYQSTNEELKSANEELETSREELQSLNEELSTVNNELQEKVAQQVGMEDRMQSYLDGLDTPTIFVDSQMRIKRFTAQAERIVNLMPSDVGRALSDITTNTRDGALVEEVRGVLRDLKYREREVQTTDGRRFLRRILPLRRGPNTFEGVVINYVDIEELKKRTEEASQARALATRAREFAKAIMKTVKDSLVLLNGSLEVVLANPAFYATFRVDKDEVEGRPFYEIGGGQWDSDDLRIRLKRVLSLRETFDNYIVEQDFSGLGRRRMVLNARTLRELESDEDIILLAIRDATDSREMKI
jgi:two-component system CheB/CheR fusion protein